MINDIEFKRAIAQRFDPTTNYSEVEDAEVEGAFEATVYQLLLEREGVAFAEEKIKVGDTVTWNYGTGTGTGKVAKIYTKPVTLKIQNSEITRNGSEENPALLITQGKTRVLKLVSEVRITEVIDASEPLDFGSIIHQVIKWNTLDIGLEYRPGEVRFPSKRNSRKLRSGYGHIRNYIGNEGEALDCYLAPAFFKDDETPSERLFQVSQISPEDGDFDEYKMMLGFTNEDEAKSAYLREMPSDYFGGIEEVAIADLDKYRKSQSVDLSETVLSTLLPYLQKIDELTNKVDNLTARFAEFTAPIAIEGDLSRLSEEEFEAIATLDDDTIQEAIEDWEQNAPEKYKELLTDASS